MNSLRDAIKGRKIQVSLIVSPEGEVEIDKTSPQENDLEEKVLSHEDAKVMKKGSMMDDSEGEEIAPSEGILGPEEMKLIKQIIASGREPTGIREKMLMDQYKLQQGE